MSVQRVFLWHRVLLCGALVVAASGAMAQLVTEGSVRYALGSLWFEETAHGVAVSHQGKVIALSSFKPGGVLAPDLSVSDDGRLHWGGKDFLVSSAKPIQPLPGRRCLRMQKLVDGALSLVHDDRAITALPDVDAEGRTIGFETTIAQAPLCKAVDRQRIAAVDVDHFFELGASRSGLWLVGGASDGPLLIRTWQGSWQKVSVPANVQGVSSAYWQGDGRLWVLANRLNGEQLTATLYSSVDLGATWSIRAKLPAQLARIWWGAVRHLAVESKTSVGR